MKNLDTIHPNLLYNQICNRLQREFGSLPTKGVIAGQAVASAIYEILGMSKKGIYNDLDIFCDHWNYPKFREDQIELHDNIEGKSKRLDKSSLNKLSNSKGAAAMWVSSFCADVGHINQTGYSILETDNDPNNLSHNYVKVSYRGYERDAPADAIINSFDINCVQAAIDVEKGTVHWTREFQDFLYGKELKTTYFGTPMHTSVRLLKKSDDIDFASLDLEGEMRKLQTIRAFMHAIENENPEKPRHFPGNLFSPIYKRRYNDRADTLNKYYELQTKDVHFWDSGETRRFYVLKPKDYCLETVKCLLKIHLENKEETPHIDEAIPYFNSLYSVFNSSVKKSAQVKSALEIIQEKSYGYRATIIFLGNALVNKDFNFQGYKKDAIKRYLKFTQQHIMFMAQMTDAEFPLDKQMKILKTGMWLQKNHMRYVIGRFENMDYETFPKEIEKWSDKNYRTDEKARHKIYMSELKSKTTPALFDDAIQAVSKDNNIEITELANKYDLFWEGEDLRHCVGGYWESILRGDSLLFSLKSEEEGRLCRSTLEIHPNRDMVNNKGGSASSIRQHRSFGNTKPTKAHEELSFKIVESIDLSIKKALSVSLNEVSTPLELACKVGFNRNKLKENNWKDAVAAWEKTGCHP